MTKFHLSILLRGTRETELRWKFEGEMVCFLTGTVGR
jgi:hypothetical protein